MAVSNFEIGKRYRMNGSDLASVEAGELLYACPIYIYYSDNSVLKFEGSSLRKNNNGDFELYTKEEELVWEDTNTSLIPTKIEFVADANTNTNTDSSYFDISTLITNQFAQVSIYNEHSSSWVDLPCASEYTGIATTIVDSGRNAEGVVIGDIIASDIAKVELKWNFLTLEQYSLIAQLFEPKYNGSFFNAVRFFDVIKGDFDGDNTTAPNTTTNRCRVMYCGDRKVAFAKIKLDDDGKPIGYQGVSLNLIDTHKIYGE